MILRGYEERVTIHSLPMFLEEAQTPFEVERFLVAKVSESFMVVFVSVYVRVMWFLFGVTERRPGYPFARRRLPVGDGEAA